MLRININKLAETLYDIKIQKDLDLEIDNPFYIAVDVETEEGEITTITGFASVRFEDLPLDEVEKWFSMAEKILESL